MKKIIYEPIRGGMSLREMKAIAYIEDCRERRQLRLVNRIGIGLVILFFILFIGIMSI